MKSHCLISVKFLLAGVALLLLRNSTVWAAQNVRVTWDANPEPNVIAYNVYCSDTLGAHPSVVSVTNITNATVGGLIEGRTYVFYITAVNSSALESDPSDSVAYQVNTCPTLSAIPDQVAQVGVAFTLRALASDPDTNQTLSFALLPGAAADATLNPQTGLLSWTPSPAFAWTSNVVGIQVTDNGVPPCSTTTTFKIVVQAPDSDGDGLPDWYERAVGLNPLDPSDASVDTDGDGFSNLEEFEAGTDPNDANSALRITSVAAAGEDIVVDFSAVPGRHYRVEATTDPTSASSWVTIADNISATDSIVSVTDAGANLQPERSYRVVLAP